MTRWARLTWQSAEPAALAADLWRRLGWAVAAESRGGTFVLPLGDAEVEVVPWRRESPSDAPSSDGRLVFEPIEGGAPDPVVHGPPPLRLAGIGWSTVELDRAEIELEAWLAGPPPDPDDDGHEPHLGARARVRVTSGLPGDALVLLEPVTEGRVAASLARDGEGPCAIYVWPPGGLDAWLEGARDRRVTASAVHPGPFGRSVLLPPATMAGPFVIVVEHGRPSSGRASPATIGA